MKLPINYVKASRLDRRHARELYIQLQEGVCYHCKQDLCIRPEEHSPISEDLFPLGFFDHPVHLHHSHETAMTLGAVHAYCNAVLWEYHGE